MTPAIREMVDMVRYVNQIKPDQTIWLRTGSGNVYKVAIIYPKEDKNNFYWNLYRCEYCPPKQSFKEGKRSYRFYRQTGGIEIPDKLIHYLTEHPDKVPPDSLSKITSFFNTQSRL